MTTDNMTMKGDGETVEDELAFAGKHDQTSKTGNGARPDPRTASAEASSAEFRRRRSFDTGDLPEGMEARYLIERRRLTGEQRYYENASDTKPAFRDRGDRLVADNNSRDLIRDMLAIAEHRGWDRIRVSGSEVFRRDAWREAALRDIAVDGYAPTPRELQEVARARARRDARSNAVAPSDQHHQQRIERRNESKRNTAPDSGRATTPSTAAGKTRISGTQDTDRVKRNGEAGRHPSDLPMGTSHGAKKRDLNLVLADRFRQATSAEAARDTQLQAAQSQFVAAKAIVSSILGHDSAAAARLIAKSRETIALAIEQGRAIPWAELRGGKHINAVRDRSQPERTKDGGAAIDVTSATKAPARNRAR